MQMKSSDAVNFEMNSDCEIVPEVYWKGNSGKILAGLCTKLPKKSESNLQVLWEASVEIWVNTKRILKGICKDSGGLPLGNLERF